MKLLLASRLCSLPKSNLFSKMRIRKSGVESAKFFQLQQEHEVHANKGDRIEKEGEFSVQVVETVKSMQYHMPTRKISPTDDIIIYLRSRHVLK